MFTVDEAICIVYVRGLASVIATRPAAVAALLVVAVAVVGAVPAVDALQASLVLLHDAVQATEALAASAEVVVALGLVPAVSVVLVAVAAELDFLVMTRRSLPPSASLRPGLESLKRSFSLGLLLVQLSLVQLSHLLLFPASHLPSLL